MKRILIISFILFASNISVANPSHPAYCDTSAGRVVLKDGNYSQKYCSTDAVMSLDDVSGCCTWQGGVFLIKAGKVICYDSSLSRVCSDIEADKKTRLSHSDDSVTIYDTHNEVSR